MGSKKHHRTVLERICLNGLTLAPPQVLGGVRLVPLLRDDPSEDLRLTRRAYGEDVGVVSLERNIAYYSYVPHGLVATWTNDNSAVFGTQVQSKKHVKPKDGRVVDSFITARMMNRMVRREGKRQLRFLPLHLAMEGFLALHFGGPDIAWSEYSRSVSRTGLSPRVEPTVTGHHIVGLEDALRVFEMHEGQVGTLVFVADALASVFVVPHPDDYRALHKTLLVDFYGELLFYYGMYATENVVRPNSLDADSISSLSDLRSGLDRLRQDWSAFHACMVGGILQREVNADTVYRFGRFQLQRFLTELDPKAENHIGEVILSNDGTVEYLKTYRLSAAQCRRAYLLQLLSESQWSLEDCATGLNCSKHELVLRVENAGFGYLLHQHVIDAAKSHQRRL